MTDVALQPAPRRKLTGPYSTFVTKVARTRRISARMIRVTLRGGDLEHFTPVGPDTFVYVLLPPTGRGELTVDASFTWEQFRAMDEAERPLGAYYTVRHHRPQIAEIDLDMVLHGDEGSGSAWAARATAGDPVALWGPRMLYAPLPTDAWQLLVADETGMPAVGAILESLAPRTRVVAVIEVADDTDRQTFDTRADVDVHWVHRDGAPAGQSDRLVAHLRTLALPGGRGYAWGGGESRAMTAVRRHLRDERGLAAEDVCVVAYWRHADHDDDEG